MIKKNLEILKKIIDNASTKSGVYQMLDKNNAILYVGKAKNLQKRLKSYLQYNNLVYKNQVMISKTVNIETIVTKSEEEAFILEGDLIKKFEPPYNILLMDDKTYPYIIFTDDKFPRISKYRGNVKGVTYFGPFASIASVDEVMKILQTVFGIRTCNNNFFKNRVRPCLLYQIKKCSGPCCDMISEEDYKRNVKDAIDFLKGKNDNLKTDLIEQMNCFSKNMEFEKAGNIRDKIKSINNIIGTSLVNVFKKENAHVFCIYKDEDKCCIVANFFENGFFKGFDKFFPKQIDDLSEGEILEQFISQFYKTNLLPKTIYVNKEVENHKLLEDALKVQILVPKTSTKLEFMKQYEENAKRLLDEKSLSIKELKFTLNLIKDDFKTKSNLAKIEVFDNSHLAKTSPIGAMIVFSNEKFSKNDYRYYNLSSSTNGDDLKMMNETIFRRYQKKERLPDLILIDGGRTQLNAVKLVLDELKLDILIACIAKGETRNSRDETIYLSNGETIKYEKGTPQLLFLERLRDEVHRFAITRNQKKRMKTNFTSELDKIEGIGDGKRKALMNYFGSVVNIKEASISELMKVNGISKNIAENIKKFFDNQYNKKS